MAQLDSVQSRQSIAWQFNCGYARVAVHELSAVKKGKSRISINRKLRAEKFQKLFSENITFMRSPEFWKDTCSSKFNVHCNFLLDCFKRKWYPTAAKDQYCESFSTSKWEALPCDVKKCHSLSECVYCAKEHLDLQKTFPGLPLFEPCTVVQLSLPSTCTSKAVEASVTRKVLAELNSWYESAFNHSFTESMLKHCGKSAAIAKRESTSSKKQKRRIMQRALCSIIEKKFEENIAINFLCENESFQAYQRRRLALSLEVIQNPPKKDIT